MQRISEERLEEIHRQCKVMGITDPSAVIIELYNALLAEREMVDNPLFNVDRMPNGHLVVTAYKGTISVRPWNAHQVELVSGE